jgi:preprotein translocase SecE subunit
VTAPGTSQAQSPPGKRTPLAQRSPEGLAEFLAETRAAYDELVGQGLRLDLTRGKPAAAQLDLSDELLSLPRGAFDQAGVDTRNYGGLAGIAELRKVVWPTRDQLVTYFIVVMVFVLIMMAIVSLLDLALGKLAFEIFDGRSAA